MVVQRVELLLTPSGTWVPHIIKTAEAFVNGIMQRKAPVKDGQEGSVLL